MVLHIRHSKLTWASAAFTWPSAANTGALLGGLTAYTASRTINTNNTTIQNKIITGGLTVNATGFVIRNCTITVTGGYGIDGDNAGRMTIEDCTITGPGTAGPGTGNSGTLGPVAMQRCNISGFENGITSQPGSTLIKYNYLHDLGGPGVDPHVDGMEIYGGENGTLIEDNRVMADDTSCVFLANLLGSLTNIIVNHNYLTGADVIIRCEGNKSSSLVTGIRLTNNVMGDANFGRFNIVAGPSGSNAPVVTGNVDELGNPVGVGD
jgi:hypothetical protein